MSERGATEDRFNLEPLNKLKKRLIKQQKKGGTLGLVHET